MSTAIYCKKYFLRAILVFTSIAAVAPVFSSGTGNDPLKELSKPSSVVNIGAGQLFKGL